MTPRTRRRVFLAALLVALTLPAEMILIQALTTPDQEAAVQEWVDSLSARELDAAASRIQAYPYLYRREIMRSLSPARRAAVWQGHVRAYVRAHPELDGEALAVLRAAESALTVDVFQDRPVDAARESLAAVGEQAVSVLGEETARYLLGDLGPKDGTFASAEPLGMKLSNFVRGQFALLARQLDCDCTPWWGCPSGGTNCTTAFYCHPDDTWPACGWGWSSTCDGLCAYY